VFGARMEILQHLGIPLVVDGLPTEQQRRVAG
jgi:hypothetical protein